MSFITQGKTNWKFLLIVIILAIIVGAGALWYSKIPEKPYQLLEIKKTEKVANAQEVNLTTTKLATISDMYELVEDAVFSPNGKKVAYLARDKEGNYIVVLDGKEIGFYDSVFGMTFTSDSKTLFYEAEKNGHYFFITDEKISQPYDFLADENFCGRHFVLISSSVNKEFVLLDGEIFGSSAYDEVLAGSIEFSADCNHLVYAAKRSNQWFVIVDKEEKGPYEEVDFPHFSSDSKHVYYGIVKNGDAFMILDDKEIGGPFFGVYDSTFSPNSERFAYTMQKERGKFFVILDGKEEGPYEQVDLLTFSPDSNHFAYTAKKNNGWFVVFDGKEVKHYKEPRPWNLMFSPDSKQFIYSAKEDGRIFLFAKDNKNGPYDSMLGWDIKFSPDSKRLSYIITEGNYPKNKYSYILDGQKSVSYDDIWHTIVSPDSKHFAYLATLYLRTKDEQRVVLLDGKEKKYDFVYLPFSFDSSSKYLYYGAKKGNELWWIVDEVE